MDSFEMEIEGFKEYQLETIVNGYCKSIVPACLVQRENRRLVYQIDDLDRVKTKLRTMETMELLKAIVFMVDDLEDHLFFVDDYLLSLDNILVNKRRGRAETIISILADRLEEDPLMRIIDQLMDRTTAYGQEILQKIKYEIIEGGIGHEELLKIIDRKCQEIYQCEIE